MARKPSDLKNKMIFAYLDGHARQRGAIGLRKARVVSVKAGRSGVSAVVVRLYDAGSGRFNGRKVSLKPNEFDNPRQPVGVLWFGKLRPIHEWLSNGAA